MTAKRKAPIDLSEQERAVWSRFDTEIRKGLQDLERGNLQDADEVFDRLEAKYQTISQNRR